MNVAMTAQRPPTPINQELTKSLLQRSRDGSKWMQVYLYDATTFPLYGLLSTHCLRNRRRARSSALGDFGLLSRLPGSSKFARQREEIFSLKLIPPSSFQ